MRQGGVWTSTAAVSTGDACCGVLCVCGAGTLAALVVDLGDPAITAWLRPAFTSSALRVILQGESRSTELMFQASGAVAPLCEQSRKCSKRASMGTLVQAIAMFVQLFNDGHKLAAWGIDVRKIVRRHLSIAIDDGL
jgi:hypothetical protein